MADFEINEDGKEAGTPLGFALFKAKSLNLTPLEVLICLEQLSMVDQDKVMRTLNNLGITEQSDGTREEGT